MGSLRRQSISGGPEEGSITEELHRVLFQHRNRLVDDECNLLTKLRIRAIPKPVRISYFPNSDRITVRWQARISGLDNKIKSALQVMPNHSDKQRELTKWLEDQDKKKVESVKEWLRRLKVASESQ